jgi:hypothetical protein
VEGAFPRLRVSLDKIAMNKERMPELLPTDAKLIENERALACGVVVPLETAGFATMARGHIHTEHELGLPRFPGHHPKLHSVAFSYSTGLT